MKFLILIAMLVLSGCSPAPDFAKDPSQIAKLAPAAQVAVLISDPLFMFAWAAIIWAGNGGSVLKIVRKIKTKATDSK